MNESMSVEQMRARANYLEQQLIEHSALHPVGPKPVRVETQYLVQEFWRMTAEICRRLEKR